MSDETEDSVVKTDATTNEVDLTAFERWELPHIQDVKVNGEEDTVQLPTAEDIEAIQQQAYQEGFSEGKKEGYAAGENEIKEHINHIKEIIQYQANPLSTINDSTEKGLIDLTAMICKKILRHEFSISEDHILTIFKEAIATLDDKESDVKIELNPEDKSVVENYIDGNSDNAINFSFLENDELQRGGCIVHAHPTRVDASVEARINELVDKILNQEGTNNDEDV